jgi:N-acetylmuramoyl-L-alanine amidase
VREYLSSRQRVSRFVRDLRLVLALVLFVSCGGGGIPTAAPAFPTPTLDPDLLVIPAGAPLPVLQSLLTSDPNDEGSYKAAIAPFGGIVLHKSTNTIVLKAPNPPVGPRRVGIQVGHWKSADLPTELAKLRGAIGARWDDVAEVDVNLDIAKRVAAALMLKGIVVDILPATVPEGYVADAFLALHADTDGVGDLSGFKLAHGPLRGPFEDGLVSAIRDAYGKATGLAYDGKHVTVDMTYYYPFNWGRFLHAASAHTPAAILEMGYLSNDDDRALLTTHADDAAKGIADGLLAFLNATPRAQIFRDDLVVQLPAASSTP